MSIWQNINKAFVAGEELTELDIQWLLDEAEAAARLRAAIKKNCTLRALGTEMIQDWAREALG
jgi:hypothetical protein